jgi:hypothetical protein
MITLDHGPNSNGLQIFNPVNCLIISSSDYACQHHITTGSRFGYKYQTGMFVYQLDESTTTFTKISIVVYCLSTYTFPTA